MYVYNKISKIQNVMQNLFLESKGLKLEIAVVFLIPIFIYFVASDMEFSQSLKIDRSTVALISMVVMMFWFVFRRITELQAEVKQRQEIELILKEIEERYSSLFERSLDFVFICNFNGDFIDANDIMLDRLDYGKEELKSLNFSQLLPLEERARAEQICQEIIRTGSQAKTAQFRMLRKNGEYIDIEVSASVIFRWNEPYAIQGIARDITERVISQNKLLSTHLDLQKTMEQLQASHEQLLQSEKLAAVGQLVAGVAHELNNPLMAISGYSEMLEGIVSDEERLQFISSLRHESDRAIKIVGNLLSFARKHEAVHLPVSINDVIQSVASLRSYELKLHNIAVNLELADDLPNISGDFQQLQQVFLNLLLNAEQAIDESGRGERITVRSREESEGIIIDFIDDGPGISPNILNRIFEPFFTTKEVGKGTGLGLSICYGIIEDHQGTISCYSSEENGTRFVIRLPIATESNVNQGNIIDRTDSVSFTNDRQGKYIPVTESITEVFHGRG